MALLLRLRAPPFDSPTTVFSNSKFSSSGWLSQIFTSILLLNNQFAPEKEAFFPRNYVPEVLDSGLSKYHFTFAFGDCKLWNQEKALEQDYLQTLEYLESVGNFFGQCFLLRPDACPFEQFCDHFSVGISFVKNMVEGGPGSTGGGIPLHEFRRDVPPGWSPGLPDYPLRLYFERLKLWYRIFEGDDTLVGPLVAGRLQGKAQRLGMQLRLPRPDGGVDVGSDALVRLSVEEVHDPSNPAVILQHSIPSGVQALCNSLREAFGVSDQEMVSRAIEDLFEFRRGRLSFQEYSIEWDIRMEEAVTRAGLELNDVGKFYLFFKGSGLPVKLVEDIKLQIQGDLRRFQEARSLALRLITRKDDGGHDHLYETEDYDENHDVYDYYADEEYWDYWQDDSWMDDGWLWYDESEIYNSEQDDWTWGAEEDDYCSGEPSEPPAFDQSSSSPAPSAASSSTTSADASESYPVGKGKGKVGCSICGSRWHSASGGKGKGYGYGPSKGYGKYGKGKKGKGRGKGKGKYKNQGKWNRKGNSYGGGGYFGYA